MRGSHGVTAPGDRGPRVRARWLPGVVVAAALVAGCSSGSTTTTSTTAPATSTSSTGLTTTTTTTGAASTTTTSASGRAVAVVATVNAWMAANGPAAGTWALTSTSFSTVDPTYALFRVGPAPGYENSVQGGYGFLHQSGGRWNVIGFGSAEVGCPPGAPTNVVVPTPVLAGFGVTCPTS